MTLSARLPGRTGNEESPGDEIPAVTTNEGDEWALILAAHAVMFNKITHRR